MDTAVVARKLEADVAIVGGGFAGLTAARRLSEKGVSVVVLEARERVGGRVLNEPVGNGKYVELGGQWVGPTQDRILGLAAELGVATFPSYTDGSRLLELGGRLRRYSGTVPRVNPLVVVDVGLLMRRVDRLSRRVSPEAPWEARGAEGLDSISFGAWLRRSARTRVARELVRIAARTVWGTEPEEMSLLHVLSYVRAGGGFEKLVDTEGGAQQDRLDGGTQALAMSIAAELRDRVVLGAPARLIARRDGGLLVEARGGSAGELAASARRAVVAVPPALTSKIEFDPPLPPARQQLGQRMPMGWLIKTVAVYDEPFWRDDGLSGEAISVTGPATLTFDGSPADGSPGAMVGFVGGADARRFARTPESERREALLRGLERLYGTRARRAERYLEQNWSAEQWSGGGPVGNFPAGAVTAVAPALREPCGPIHWAGTETATVWCGYIEGAVRSGERAAAEVLAAL